MNINFGLTDKLFEIEDSTTSIGADVDELNNEETVENPDEETLESDDEPEQIIESDEEETLVEEEEEPEEKPLEPELVTHPFDRPSIKDLNTAYPDLFKKFPSLKDMYFREAEFSKIFPTIDEAREAMDNNTAFVGIRNDIFSGDGSKFISAIKEVDEKGLSKFASNFLPNLIKTSPDSFWRAANPLIEDVAKSMFQKGVNEGNENLQNAARFLSKFYFGEVDYAEGKKTSIIKDEPSPVDTERAAFENEKDTAFRGSVETDLKTQLVDLVTGSDPKTGKSRIDPDEVLSPFIKSMIIEKVIKDLDVQLGADKGHLRYMTSLWGLAKKNGRTDGDKARIVSAYLARAKSIITSLRSKYVSEALGKRARSASQERDKVSRIPERSSSSGRPSGKPRSGGKIDYSKTSDLDILNDNVTYRN